MKTRPACRQLIDVDSRIKATAEVAEKLRPVIERMLVGRDMYCLRKTHISWARRLVSPDAVRLQVGHAGRDVEERHYLDLVGPGVSFQAVWDILTGNRTLDGKYVSPAQNKAQEMEKSQDVGPTKATFPKTGEKTA